MVADDSTRTSSGWQNKTTSSTCRLYPKIEQLLSDAIASGDEVRAGEFARLMARHAGAVAVNDGRRSRMDTSGRVS